MFVFGKKFCALTKYKSIKIIIVQIAIIFLFSGKAQAAFDSASRRTIVIIGSEYEGLVTAGYFAQQASNLVIVVEKNKDKIQQLRTRKFDFCETGLKNLVYGGIARGNLIFVPSISQAFTYNPEFVFMCFDVSLSNGVNEGLDEAYEVAVEVGRNIKGYCIVVNKLIAPVGTTDLLKTIIQRQINKREKQIDFGTVFAAEFRLNMKSAPSDVHYECIVIGAEQQLTKDALALLYKPFIKKKSKTPFIFTDSKSAELIKYASIAAFATNFSLINQLALLADAVGVDIQQIKYGILKGQASSAFLTGSELGYRDNGISKNIAALVHTGIGYKRPMGLVCEANQANKQSLCIFIKNILRHYGESIDQKHIGIWGLAVKPETDDLEGAPAVKVIQKLCEAGACVTVYDPAANKNIKALFSKKIRVARCADEILRICDCLIILTDWKEFLCYEPEKFLSLKDKLIFDGCGCFDPQKMIAVGLKYFVIGRNIFVKNDLSPTEKASNCAKTCELKINKKVNDRQNLENLLLENNMAHVFEDSIKDIDWIKSKNFSPRGGAANYSFLYILFRILQDVKPQSIIEFGIGQSSKLTSQYIAYSENTKSRLTLVEHDSLWINVFQKQLPDCNRIKLLNLEIEDIEVEQGTQIFQTTTYKDLNKNIGDQKFDCILVDGPHGEPHYSRFEVLDLLERNLADNFVIVIDDYNRVGEHETAQKVLKKLENLSINYETTTYKGITTQLIVYSPSYSFLKSL